MKITKLYIVALGLATIFIGAASAETGSLSLSEQLISSKDMLVTQINTTTQTLESEYNRLILPKVDTANYQSLICLGVVEDENLLLQLQNKLDLLKTNFLQDYVDINAEIFNLLNQYSVGLIDEVVYITQYEKLLLDAQSFYDNHKILISKANTEYLEKLFNFVSESEGYTNNNSELLDSLNDKISKIQSSMHEFIILEEGIFEINNALNLQQGNFFDTLQSTRNTVATMLTSELNQQIQRYDRKYTNNPELKTSYEQKRDATINGFTSNLDQKIDDMIGSRYDAEEYSYVKEQIGIIKAKFYDGEGDSEKLNCEKVITTNLDLEGYINDVEKAVVSLREDVSAGVVTLTNAGTGTDPKEELLASFKELYIINYNTDLEAFKSFVRADGTTTTIYPTTTETSTNTTVSLTIIPYTFDRPFEKGEISDGVKQLQNLLTKLGYYKGQIFGKYDTTTTEAVYQFQLAKGILKGVAGETAQGYVGPSTRYALNEAIKNYLKPIVTATSEATTDTETTEPIITENTFLSLIKTLEVRYDNKEAFVVLMQKALVNLTIKLDDDITTSKKLVFENIIKAIEEYLAE